MAIRGILFDIGDTLVGATLLQQTVLLETVRDLPAKSWVIDSNAFLQSYQEADSDPSLDLELNVNHLYSDPLIVERAFALLSRSFSETFLKIYRTKLRSKLRYDSQLVDIMTNLRNHGIRLGIVSNGTSQEQREQLTLLGIIEFFDPILISQEVGVLKPDPRIFLLAKEKWLLEPAEILVVGDRGDWEVLGAKRAGMQSALTTQFVDRRDTIPPNVQPDYIIERLDQLLPIVKEAL
ncbi:MAG: HAD family hydrolase [Anaerolineae bacterium]|nr:HAD family hydrolase [Anaerolineae bacterium]